MPGVPPWPATAMALNRTPHGATQGARSPPTPATVPHHRREQPPTSGFTTVQPPSNRSRTPAS